MQLLIIVTPGFNLAATMAFIDPFRAANYLEGTTHFRWSLSSPAGGSCLASNGVSVATTKLSALKDKPFAIVVVATSGAPERVATAPLLAALRRWERSGSILGALDTGAFILADAGLLRGRRATVHYEHLGAFRELHDDLDVVDDIFVREEKLFTCSGGAASADAALHLIAAAKGMALASAAMHYIFHPQLRADGTSQNPSARAAVGSSLPEAVRRAIEIMERHLEDALPIPALCAKAGISQRQLDRLFQRHIRKSPARYYRDIRLDRARGLVTQTDMLLSEIAVACGFASQVHFSRAYRSRFGRPPRQDRVEGRIPFELRAWPLDREAFKPPSA